MAAPSQIKAPTVWGRSPRMLLAIEVLALLVFVGLAATLVIESQRDTALVALDVDALRTGQTAERWSGIFFQDQKVGYAVSRVSGASGGGTLYEERSLFRLASFGKLQEVVTAGTAYVGPEGKLRQFDFFMAADPVRLSARGEVHERQVVMEITQAGEVSTLTFPISEAPHVGMSLENRIRAEELAVGHSFTVPYFDPVSMAEGQMEIEVVDVEVLDNAEEAYWLRSRFGDVETRSLVLPTGETIRQEGGLGLSIVRMSRADATQLPDTAPEDVDLISMSAAPLVGNLEGDPRKVRKLVVEVYGVPPDRLRNEPPLQTIDGVEVTIDRPLLEALPELPVVDRSDEQWVQATRTLQASDQEIIQKASEVIGDAEDRLTAVKRLNAFVFDYLDKVPTLSVPNGLEALRTAQGDCNEHTALFVSLARSAGIPTRIAAGLVYSDRVGDRGAFYYHAWPEVLLGGPTEWVPVDPTFGQVPADATHVKIVEGDLERQIEIMGVMGKLHFELVEAL